MRAVFGGMVPIFVEETPRGSAPAATAAASASVTSASALSPVLVRVSPILVRVLILVLRQTRLTRLIGFVGCCISCHVINCSIVVVVVVVLEGLRLAPLSFLFLVAVHRLNSSPSSLIRLGILLHDFEEVSHRIWPMPLQVVLTRTDSKTCDGIVDDAVFFDPRCPSRELDNPLHVLLQ